MEKESQLLRNFNLWLISPDGKRKKARQSKQHARQVELKEIGGNELELFERKK